MSRTEWTAEATYMPGVYVVLPDGDLRWLEWSPKFVKADARLMANRLNEKGIPPEMLLSALGTLERITPTTTIQVVESLKENHQS